MISTHAPLARRDNCSHFNKPKKHNFYSRASREARLAGRCPRIYIQRFLLTRLSRGATITNIIIPMITKFLLTRLSRGATSLGRQELHYCYFYSRASREARHHSAVKNYITVISTHAPLARRDDSFHFVHTPSIFISTHAPLARRDYSRL